MRDSLRVLVAADSLMIAVGAAHLDYGLRPGQWRYLSDPWRQLRGTRDTPVAAYVRPSTVGLGLTRLYWDEVEEAFTTGYARRLPADWHAGIVFDHDAVRDRIGKAARFVGPFCADCGKRLDSHYSYGAELAEMMREGHPLDYITALRQEV